MISAQKSWLAVASLIVRFFLWFCLLAYLLIAGGVIFFQRTLLYANIYHDPHTVADVAEFNLKEIQVTTADGLTIKSWYSPPAKVGKPVVLMFNGQGGSPYGLRYLAEIFQQRGFGTLITGYRGFHGNPGTPTEGGLYEDARANAQFIQSNGYDIILYGISLGTGVAVQLATELNAKALVLTMPYASITETASARYWFLPVKWLLLDRFDSLAKISKVRAPVLIQMGDEDTLIAPDQAVRLYQAAPNPKQFIWMHGRGHFNVTVDDIRQGVNSFLDGLGL